VRSLLAVASTLLALALASACGPAGHGTAVGAPASNFTLKDVNGRQVSLSDHFGKNVVLLDFWATWCVPCEAEMPHLQRLYQRHKEQGFVVLGVSMDGPETVASVAPYARRMGLTFPMLLDEETQVTNVYNPQRTAPLTVLIDRDGRVRRVHPGYKPGDEVELDREVAALVTGGGTGAPASQPK
jgi:peroxiredoxin